MRGSNASDGFVSMYDVGADDRYTHDSILGTWVKIEIKNLRRTSILDSLPAAITAL